MITRLFRLLVFLGCVSVMGSVLAQTEPQTQSIGALIENLKSYQESLRTSAREELVKRGDPAVRPLFDFIRAESEAAKSLLADAFAAAVGGNTAGASSLQREARRHDDNLRYAFEILGKIGAPAVEPLLDSLKEPRSRYRSLVVKTLGEIGDKRAVEVLIALLREDDRSIRTEAVGALEKMTGEKLGDDPAKWDEWWAANKPK